MKVPLILSLVTYGIYKLLLFYTSNQLLSLSVFLIPLGLLVINFMLRKHLKYKNWFTSYRNFLIEKEVQEFTSDIEASLLYEKIKSVIQESDFKLADENSKCLLLLATTSTNFWTWGENLYIQIDPKTEKIKVTSTTIYGSYSWKRNKANHNIFFNQFEKSLTI